MNRQKAITFLCTNNEYTKPQTNRKPKMLFTTAPKKMKYLDKILTRHVQDVCWKLQNADKTFLKIGIMCLWIGRLNLLKRLFSPNRSIGFNAISNKTSAKFS